MIINKITIGFVVQQYDTEAKKFINQTFTASDDVSWETPGGNYIEEPPEAPNMPLEMVHPGFLTDITAWHLTNINYNHHMKENGYSTFHLKAKQKRKRAEAEARQDAYDKLTIAEKFATLIPDGSKKQRAKLNKQLEAAVKKGVPKVQSDEQKPVRIPKSKTVKTSKSKS